MSATTPTPDELLDKANEVFALRNSRRPFLAPGDVLVGDVPHRGGAVLRVMRRCDGRRQPLFSIRVFDVASNGLLRPTASGLEINAPAFASFAGLVAKALQGEIDEIEGRSTRTSDEQ